MIAESTTFVFRVSTQETDVPRPKRQRKQNARVKENGVDLGQLDAEFAEVNRICIVLHVLH